MKVVSTRGFKSQVLLHDFIIKTSSLLPLYSPFCPYSYYHFPRRPLAFMVSSMFRMSGIYWSFKINLHIKLLQLFWTGMPQHTGALQELLKHAIADYSVRGTDLFSLRFSNKTMTTANTTIAIWYE